MKDLKLFKILNDEIFWEKYKRFCLSDYRLNRLREYRTKKLLPGRKMLHAFVQDYKTLQQDKRNKAEIIAELLSVNK